MKHYKIQFKTFLICLFRSAKYFCVFKPPVSDCRPVVGIIITCFNYSDYSETALMSALESIKGSSINYQIIIVDDHSTDDTMVRISKIAAEHNNIHVLQHASNMGLTQSWNTGLRYVIEELDADFIFISNNDVIFPSGVFERLVHHLESLPIALIGPITNAPGHRPRQNIRKYVGKYVASDDLGQINQQQKSLANNPPIIVKRINGFFFGGKSQIFKNNLFSKLREVYYFNPYYRNIYNEDEFENRLIKKGLNMCIATDCFIFHYKDVTLKRWGHHKEKLKK